MEMEKDDLIIENFRIESFAPMIVKKSWYEANKERLLHNGWRTPSKRRIYTILKDNDLTPFKEKKKAGTKTVKKEGNKEA